MRWLTGLIELVLSAVSLGGVGGSVARTVVVPRNRSSRLLHGTLRVVLAGARLTRLLPHRSPRPRVLDLLLPITLLLTVLTWLCWLAAGFALLAMSAGIAADPHALAATLLLAPGPDAGLAGRAVGLAAWGSAGLVVLLALACLPTIAAAYLRRERLVRQLSSQALAPPDAEHLLAAYLQNALGPSYDGVMTEWDAWFNDVRITHAAFPVLVTAPPAGQLCWLKAMVIMLDVAALVDALAPSRAVPHARALLRSGTACLDELAGQVRLAVLHTGPSLQGREEYDFPDTVARVLEAGLPVERDEHRARETFQAWRRRYAPHATVIAAYLRYDSPLYRPAGWPLRRLAAADRRSRG